MAKSSRNDALSAVAKRRLIATLRKLYPEPRSELIFRNEFELVVSVVLSAQCTDKKVNQVTPSLFSAYPSFATLARADQSRVAEIIRPINYYKTKAKHLVGLATIVTNDFNGTLPATIDDLTRLPGVGRKTASVVVCERGMGGALPVDTHVFRVSRRLGLSSGTTVSEVELDLRKNFNPRLWHDLHHWLIFHGRRVCKARAPLCSACVLNSQCPSRETHHRG